MFCFTSTTNSKGIILKLSRCLMKGVRNIMEHQTYKLSHTQTAQHEEESVEWELMEVIQRACSVSFPPSCPGMLFIILIYLHDIPVHPTPCVLSANTDTTLRHILLSFTPNRLQRCYSDKQYYKQYKCIGAFIQHWDVHFLKIPF